MTKHRLCWKKPTSVSHRSQVYLLWAGEMHTVFERGQLFLRQTFSIQNHQITKQMCIQNKKTLDSFSSSMLFIGLAWFSSCSWCFWDKKRSRELSYCMMYVWSLWGFWACFLWKLHSKRQFLFMNIELHYCKCYMLLYMLIEELVFHLGKCPSALDDTQLKQSV